MHKLNKEYVSYQELYIAYMECRRKKRGSRNEIIFEIDENVKLLKLYYRLNELKYEVGDSIYFIVRDPVIREIFAADFVDRIVHHLFIRRITAYLEQTLINDCYSCRVGKGTSYGIQRCAEMMRECSDNYTKDCYVFKGDFKTFFLSVNRKLLYNITYRFLVEVCKFEGDYLFFTDYLLRKILFDDARTHCKFHGTKSDLRAVPRHKSWFNCGKDDGIPIGNLPSQALINLFLSAFDWWVTTILGFIFYGRYVDDFFLFNNDLNAIITAIPKIEAKLKEFGITLHPNKRYLQHISKGVKFIGAVIKPNRTYITNRTNGNAWEAINNTPVPNTVDELNHFVGSVNSYLGFMIHYSTYNIRKKLLTSQSFLWFYKYGYSTPNYNKIVLNKTIKNAAGDLILRHFRNN